MKRTNRVFLNVAVPPFLGLLIFSLSLTALTLVKEPKNVLIAFLATAVYGAFIALTKGILVSIGYMALMEVWYSFEEKKRNSFPRLMTYAYSGLLGLLSGLALTHISPFSNMGDILVLSLGIITGLLMPSIVKQTKAEIE
ncbi:hypothetical protein SH580_03985 [Coraliomargarita algicola]|uniref:Uncharacterized protein n=1 Tax=Coraliomargarita algicola TaxID=3092156 RepID=A0ABZ0RPG6_9BACT|nr:hypothetical protein [Coraliomargarita sp. J2-16]WPJ96865.1 hypothetical protein SH580_03985 [Coraliomargarita sp. J2-16]